MSKRLEGAPPALATELLRAALELQPNGDPKSAADVAAELLARSDLAELRNRFASPAELAQALEEYRASGIFLEASKSLAGQIDIPPLAPGAPAAKVELQTLLQSALRMRSVPRAAAALDQVVYVVQALGGLQLGGDKLTMLVQSGLQLGATLATAHQSEEPRQ
jgi:hypothetical protein